jgi:hypothetical protein
MEHFRSAIFGQTIVFRDLMETDIETIVDYWHGSDPGFLQSLGADLSKLTSRSATRERLSLTLNRGPEAHRAYFVIASERELLAYTNLNFRSTTDACAHFHVLKRTSKVKATAYVVFPDVMRAFFSLFPLERIEMQTLPENRNIDQLLQRFGLQPRRAFMTQPDGFARPGELNIWEIRRDDVTIAHRHLERSV